MMGMEVVLAHPEGMELDPNIINQCESYANSYGGSFSISNEFEDAIKGAHVVYPKAWCATPIFQNPIGEASEEKAKAIFEMHKNWKCATDTMALADKNAIYMHCLPADRGFEVESAVMDKLEGPGWTSAIYDQAENRLHGQKAVMALLMQA
jgi:N-acetylornithine carbamoyltransferase